MDDTAASSVEPDRDVPASWRGSLAVLAAALILYGALAVRWSGTFPSATLPADAYFGFDSHVTYDAATRSDYRNDRLYALHPLYGAALHALTLPLIASGLDAKQALLACTVLAAALQVALLYRIADASSVPRLARTAIVLAFAGSSTQLVQATAQDSYVFTGLAFMMLFHHAFAVLVQGATPSLMLLGAVGIALMATTVTNVLPFALASAVIVAPASGSQPSRGSLLLVVTVVLVTVVAAWMQRWWFPEATWFPAELTRALIANDTGPVARELHLVQLPASAITSVIEGVRNLLLLPWVLAGFSAYAESTTRAAVFFLRLPSLTAWLIWGACGLLTAAAARRASWPPRLRRFAAAIAVVLCFHLALHAVYGRSEGYLYAPHYLGALALLVALAWRGLESRRVASVVVALAALLLVGTNVRHLWRFYGAFEDVYGRCVLVRHLDGSAACRNDPSPADPTPP